MTQGADQSEFKVMVKQWLKRHRLDYRWVAEQCGVSEITVRNWMSQKNIPPLKLQLLEKVMVQMPAAGSRAAAAAEQEIPGVRVNASLALTIQLAPELYTRLAERAATQGMTMEALVAQAIAQLVHTPDAATAAALRSRKVILPTER